MDNKITFTFNSVKNRESHQDEERSLILMCNTTFFFLFKLLSTHILIHWQILET